ncbi:uncharacterized protein LOC119724957 [Patiria miniata]|uniref:Uncharacterized protein n=1 Tax=Patiria miniata TaxID=46514 RepID=A0A913ZLL2_PATMI|nr:uncharacterized protein LOC119724957 [Patiria miniata]
MTTTRKAVLMAAFKLVCRRVIRQPLKMLCLLVILLGVLHLCLRKRERAAGWEHAAHGPGSHGLPAAVGVGRGIVDEIRVPDMPHGRSELGTLTSNHPATQQDCSNTKMFPSVPGCIIRGLNFSRNENSKNIFHLQKFGSLSTRKSPAPFPWPKRENYASNYFLTVNNTPTKANSSSTPTDSALVFLHHNKAAGTTAKECLRQVVKATDRELGHVLSNEGRLNLMSNFRKLRRRGKRIPDTFFGGYAFGVCDELHRPCSYFTVLRDPYKRTLSSHSYCQKARTDQLCTALRAEKVSLREWALHQGSFFFRQLVFHPEFCSDQTKWIPFVDLVGEPHEFDGPETLEGATCWFRQKLIMSLTLNRTQHDAVLQYCLDNLERWFKVIMLVDEFDLSLAMMEHAYKLPFHELCSGSRVNIGSYDKQRNATDSLRRNSANSSIPDTVLNQLRELEADPEVRDALRADVMIYRKGVEIFEKQKDTFMKMNRVGTVD